MQVCVSFADSHFVDGFQYIAQGLVLAHQCIASRNQDIPELSVVLEIFHQFSQPLVPALFRFQFLEVEVQTFTLEVVHALAGCTQAAACTSHRVGDKNGHIGITAVNVVSVRQQPSCSVRLSVLHSIFFFPCVDVTVCFHQLGRVQNIASYGCIIISFPRRIQQRQIVRGDKDRHSFLACFVIKLQGLLG